MIISVMTYPVITSDYSEVEAICRGIVNMTIFIYVYTRDVINEYWLGVSIALSMIYIIFSFWRVSTRDDCAKAREGTVNLLSCCCCISDRAKDVTFQDDETSDMELENSLGIKL